MDLQQKKILKFFRFRRIIVPIVIGLGVATFLLVRSFDRTAFEAVEWSLDSYIYIFYSLVLMAIRDLAYMYRLRVLTMGRYHGEEALMLLCSGNSPPRLPLQSSEVQL
jgi:glycosyltransferase 2 family protein